VSKRRSINDRNFSGTNSTNCSQSDLYAIVIEGTRSKRVSQPHSHNYRLTPGWPTRAKGTILQRQAESPIARTDRGRPAPLEQRVRSFMRQLSDFVQLSLFSGMIVFVSPPAAQLRRMAYRRPPESGQFLDYQVANSNIEAERDHLRVGDHFVRVLTMKRRSPRPSLSF